MKLSFWTRLIIILISFNLTLGQPAWVWAQALPTEPTAPTAPTAPLSPTEPTAPTAPTAPTPPGASPSPSASPTPAPSNEASNTATGADSTNQSTVDNQTNTQVSNENAGEVVNDVNSQTMTGGNTASYNTGGGQINTGDANQSLNVVTNLNQNTILTSPNGLSTNQANNLLTGSGSQNTSAVTSALNNATTNNNTGSLTNKILVNSVSGQNFSSYNTGVGSVKTGDANADLSLLSSLNTNVTGAGGIKTFNIYDTHVGDLVFKMEDFTDGIQFQSGNPASAYNAAAPNVADNSTTGASSQNTAATTDTDNQTVANQNQGVLTNDITINAITGANNTTQNSGEGAIETGDANAVGTLINFLNTNLVVDQWAIGVVNVFGELLGDIVLPQNEPSPTTTASTQNQAANTTTGADSVNQAQDNNQSTASFTNYNEAEVLNNIETAAVTGANTASYNTGPGQVEDGNATVNTSAVTVANNNTVGEGETLWLVLVNKMGEWIGQIVGQDPGETMAGNLIDQNDTTASAVTPQTDQAANEQTGADSTNQAINNNQDNLSVTNQNEAKIENNIKVVAQTGNNSGSYNTLGGDINAGDANVALSLVNFVNTNLVGKKLIVLVVNVLDKWIGNIIPPDEEQNPQTDDSSGTGGLPSSDNENQNSTPTQSQNPQVNGDSSNNSTNLSDNSVYSEQNSIFARKKDTPATRQGEIYFNNFGFNQDDFNGGSLVSSVRSTYKRSLFFSQAFAMGIEDGSQEQPAPKVTSDWLYFLLPSFFGVVLGRNKKIRTALLSFL